MIFFLSRGALLTIATCILVKTTGIAEIGDFSPILIGEASLGDSLSVLIGSFFTTFFMSLVVSTEKNHNWRLQLNTRFFCSNKELTYFFCFCSSCDPSTDTEKVPERLLPLYSSHLFFSSSSYRIFYSSSVSYVCPYFLGIWRQHGGG